MYIPIKQIRLIDGIIEPQSWDEPLYVEFFLELGGHNIKDIDSFLENPALFDKQILQNYLKCIAHAHPIFENIDWKEPDAMKTFMETIVLKHCGMTLK